MKLWTPNQHLDNGRFIIQMDALVFRCKSAFIEVWVALEITTKKFGKLLPIASAGKKMENGYYTPDTFVLGI
ncbi:hypothetical protein A6769_01530 [Nostoc punctiforme NIES-2108]|uniref:Uncharacterized protein n=1 Tax=Nostoc punctiforme NIES-2108 TaxID=1356359 RepID=A0A367S056_NOSPU|nr:hypothetical protein A6769_01530 [Nostoc punctiforme NIES-2108]